MPSDVLKNCIVGPISPAGMPLNTWMFLKTSSATFGAEGVCAVASFGNGAKIPTAKALNKTTRAGQSHSKITTQVILVFPILKSWAAWEQIRTLDHWPETGLANNFLQAEANTESSDR